MRALGSKIAGRVAIAIDLAGVKKVLDVGGGFGHYAAALCARQSGFEISVLDIPPVADMARLEIKGTAFEDRIRFVGGDYMETDYGTGYDLVLIANVLHQESPPRAADLIRRAAAALESGGRLAVVDFRIDDDQREHPLGALFAINMRSFGDTHTEPSIRGWMVAAGLEEITRTDVDAQRWMIVGHRPTS
jgi:protein-L-isoaspartate O-methyltransferase